MTDSVLLPAVIPVHAELEAFGGERHVRRLIVRGGVVVGAFFVLLGGWSAVARLDSGAVSYGVVQSDASRKTVQHLDGGVVSSVLVKEGDYVRQGQELIRLDTVQAKAVADITTAAVDALTAEVARLQAEQAGMPRIVFPARLTTRAADPAVAQLMTIQVKLFDARRSDLVGADGTLGQQAAQADSQAIGYVGQIQATDAQYALIQEELKGLQKLYDQGYATKPRLLAMQRAAAALTGQKQEYQADIDRLHHTSGQAQAQSAQLRRDRLSTVAQELGEAEAKLATALEQESAAKAVLDRTVIRAPAEGHVLGLTAAVGTVIAKGEPIMQVIPTEGSPVVEARLKPGDGAHVKAGMPVQLRVSGTEGRSLPMLQGSIQSRSADLLTDPKTGAPFYTIKVVVDPRDAALVKSAGLGVGAPMQVIVPTGSRTALQYIFEPLQDSFRRGLRER